MVFPRRRSTTSPVLVALSSTRKRTAAATMARASTSATVLSSTTNGGAELKALWKDPDFDPNEKAFYYVRALENPTCRWSTWDAVRAGTDPRPDLSKTIQERAWTSPIWYAAES